MLEQYVEAIGYSGKQLPDIAARYEGKGLGLVVCGDAAGVWDDLEAFGCRCDHRRGSVQKDGFHFLTINKLVEVFPGNIEHAYSNEPHLLEKFIAARRQEYRGEFDGPRNTHAMRPGAKWVWPLGGWATSGLGAALVGVGMGYAPVVLCGVPLDDGPHNGEPHWRKCRFASSEAAGSVATGKNGHWEKAKQFAFQGKVKSMSGRTREWLGSP